MQAPSRRLSGLSPVCKNPSLAGGFYSCQRLVSYQDISRLRQQIAGVKAQMIFHKAGDKEVAVIVTGLDAHI